MGPVNLLEMKTRYCYLSLLLRGILLSGLTACKKNVPEAGWTTEDETIIEKRWMLFPDEDGNIFNISLIKEDNIIIPHDCDTINDVSFWLYTRKNIHEPQNLISNNVESLRNSNFIKKESTKLIIHGWRNNKHSKVNARLVNAYLTNWNVNVIVVDWGNIAQRINYYSVRNYLQSVGKIVADFINFLLLVGKINLAQIHIIGHSLGAHVAGYAGSEIGTGTISAITGLDPALPLFSINDPKNRLDKTDAKYVEIIHTDAGRLGFALPLGHVDFYPNKGTKQPGCGYDIIGTCGHSRSVEYFEESLRSEKGFLGIRCESYEEAKNGNCSVGREELRMGGKLPKFGYHGQYFLKTGAVEPFGQVDK